MYIPFFFKLDTFQARLETPKPSLEIKFKVFQIKTVLSILHYEHCEKVRIISCPRKIKV